MSGLGRREGTNPALGIRGIRRHLLCRPEELDAISNTDLNRRPYSSKKGGTLLGGTTIIIWNVFQRALMITLFIFVMMLLLDFVNVLSRGKATRLVRGGAWRQYLLASFLGTTPGCLGAFLNVSFYVHGLISFGALLGGMIATSGDEAFVMLALFPRDALMLFGFLFILGILLGWLSDRIVGLLKLKTCRECIHQQVHEAEAVKPFDLKSLIQNALHVSLPRLLLLAVFLFVFGGMIFGLFGPPAWGWKKITFVSLMAVALGIIAVSTDHYFQEHIWDHIVKKHLWSVFLWSFFAMLFVELGFQHLDLEGFVQNHLEWVGLLAVLLGLIPESGPHMVIVMLYSKGLIPFSILLASSIVQDGHGMLPLLSYTVRDSFLVKLLNLLFGVVVGLALYWAGL